MAMRRLEEGSLVGGGDGGGGGGRKRPLTEKSTKVSTKEERRLGMSLQIEVGISFSISISNWIWCVLPSPMQEDFGDFITSGDS